MKKNTGPKKFLFEKRNYRFLFLALIVISVGFILMTGGGSEDPNYFNEEIFNFRRIRIAPTLILIGFGIAMYSILTREISKK
jgi:drug/metabolite transporter (DMT)-like permease